MRTAEAGVDAARRRSYRPYDLSSQTAAVHHVEVALSKCREFTVMRSMQGLKFGILGLLKMLQSRRPSSQGLRRTVSKRFSSM